MDTQSAVALSTPVLILTCMCKDDTGQILCVISVAYQVTPSPWITPGSFVYTSPVLLLMFPYMGYIRWHMSYSVSSLRSWPSHSSHSSRCVGQSKFQWPRGLATWPLHLEEPSSLLSRASLLPSKECLSLLLSPWLLSVWRREKSSFHYWKWSPQSHWSTSDVLLVLAMLGCVLCTKLLVW